MLISFDCPKCLKPARGELPSASGSLVCGDCGWTRPTEQGSFKNESPKHCVVCGCHDLWRQKDFPQQLGLLIVGLGVVLSTIAIAYMRPGVAMLILMGFGLADWILYAVLPDRLVCYRCHAQYRRVPNRSASEAFDLEVNERYRQEAIRLQQVQNAQK